MPSPRESCKQTYFFFITNKFKIEFSKQIKIKIFLKSSNFKPSLSFFLQQRIVYIDLDILTGLSPGVGDAFPPRILTAPPQNTLAIGLYFEVAKLMFNIILLY